MTSKYLSPRAQRGVCTLAAACGFLATLGMTAGGQSPRVIKPDTFFNTLWRGHPVVARIKPNEVVSTRLLDAGARDYMNVQRAQPSNPMVGHIYIEGAEPGDAIGV